MNGVYLISVVLMLIANRCGHLIFYSSVCLSDVLCILVCVQQVAKLLAIIKEI